jgi:hypothetical protein
LPKVKPLGGRFPLKGGNSNLLLLDVNMGETVTWTGKGILTIAESAGELITNPIAVLGTSARGDPVTTSVGVFAGSPHDFEQIRFGVGSRSDEWPLCLWRAARHQRTVGLFAPSVADEVFE